MMKQFSLIAALALTASSASASPIVYRGTNPHINPAAYAAYEASTTNAANITRPKNSGRTSSATRLSESDLLKQSTLAGLSSRYTQLLTGNSTTQGTVNFGDGSYAEYDTISGVRYITFHNLDGSTTEISFPL